MKSKHYVRDKAASLCTSEPVTIGCMKFGHIPRDSHPHCHNREPTDRDEDDEDDVVRTSYSVRTSQQNHLRQWRTEGGGCSTPPRNSEDIGRVLDRMSKKNRRLDFLL